MRDDSTRPWHSQGPDDPFHGKANTRKRGDQKVKLGSILSVCWNKNNSLKGTLV